VPCDANVIEGASSECIDGSTRSSGALGRAGAQDGITSLRIIGDLFACGLFVVPVLGQERVASPAAACDINAGVSSELSQFLSGDWAGAGQFASGKPIEADVTFAPELDGHWLVYHHVDRAPGRYKVRPPPGRRP
jgi:hypothetical protein